MRRPEATDMSRKKATGQKNTACWIAGVSHENIGNDLNLGAVLTTPGIEISTRPQNIMQLTFNTNHFNAIWMKLTQDGSCWSILKTS
jgi:hypothetical protein